MLEPKDFYKVDAAFTVAYLAYFLLAQGKINETYSSGWVELKWFFCILNITILLLQILLILSDFKQKKSMVITLRSAIMAYLFGMLIIVTKMGLLTWYFLLIFFVAQALNLLMFCRSLSMPNDVRIV